MLIAPLILTSTEAGSTSTILSAGLLRTSMGIPITFFSPILSILTRALTSVGSTVIP